MVVYGIDRSSFKAAAAAAGSLASYEYQIKNWQQQFSPSSPQYALAAAVIAEIKQLSNKNPAGKLSDLQSWFQNTYFTRSSQPIFGDIFYEFPGLTSEELSALSGMIGLPPPTFYPFDQFLWELTNYSYDSTDGQRVAQQIIHLIMDQDASSYAASAYFLKRWSQQNIFNEAFYKNYPNISAADIAGLQDLLDVVAPQKPAPTLPEIRAYFKNWVQNGSGPQKAVGNWAEMGFLNGTVRSIADLQYFVQAANFYQLFPGITPDDVRAVYDQVRLPNPPTK